MIQQTSEYRNRNHVRLYASTNNGSRIIGDTVMDADSNSTTISRKPITEVPEGVLPEQCDIATARSVLAGMVLEGDLLDDEVEALLSVYRKWSDLDDGTILETGDMLAHDGQLYRIVQGHNKQSDWPPDTTAALFTKAVPENVIPEWVQPQGAHDAYQIGDKVTFNGHIWESKINANVWSPSVYPAGWADLGAV